MWLSLALSLFPKATPTTFTTCPAHTPRNTCCCVCPVKCAAPWKCYQKKAGTGGGRAAEKRRRGLLQESACSVGHPHPPRAALQPRELLRGADPHNTVSFGGGAPWPRHAPWGNGSPKRHAIDGGVVVRDERYDIVLGVGRGRRYSVRGGVGVRK
jgi:hypothetical protein